MQRVINKHERDSGVNGRGIAEDLAVDHFYIIHSEISPFQGSLIQPAAYLAFVVDSARPGVVPRS